MKENPQAVPISVTDELRAQLLDRIKATSLASVARAAEMPPSALNKFLSGAPLPNSRRTRLSQWLRETEQWADERATACMRCVMELVAEIPDRHQMKAVGAVLEALRAEFKPPVASAPLWLSRLVAAHDTAQQRQTDADE